MEIIILVLIMLLNDVCVVLYFKKKYRDLYKFNETIINEESVDPDEFLNSLKFNTELDSYIVRLLGTMSKQSMISKITELVYSNHTEINNIDRNRMKEYIEDVLRNYPDTYVEKPKKEETVEYLQEEPVKQDTSIQQQSNISNVLNDFYKY